MAGLPHVENITHIKVRDRPFQRAYGARIFSGSDVVDKSEPSRIWPELWDEYLDVRQNSKELGRFVVSRCLDKPPFVEAVFEKEFGKKSIFIPDMAIFHESVMSILEAMFIDYASKSGIYSMLFERYRPWSILTDVGRSNPIYAERVLKQDLVLFKKILADKSVSPLLHSYVLMLLRAILNAYDTRECWLYDLAEGSEIRDVYDLVYPFLSVDGQFYNVFLAYEILQMIYDIEEADDEELSIGEYPSAGVRQSMQFGLKKYFSLIGSPKHDGPHDHLYNFFMWDALHGSIYESGDRAVSLRDILPIHSLADYNPNPSVRKSITAGYLTKLRAIVEGAGLTRESLFKAFGLPSSGDTVADVKVLLLGDGSSYLIQGHHRMAALIMAGLEGLIPMDWLNGVPLHVMKTAYHHALARPLVTRGVQLAWPDLFPAGTDFKGFF